MVVLSRCECHVSSRRATVIEQCRQADLGPSMDYLFCMAHSRKPSSTALTCARFHHRRATTHCGLHLSISLSKSDLCPQPVIPYLIHSWSAGLRHSMDAGMGWIELQMQLSLCFAGRWRRLLGGNAYLGQIGNRLCARLAVYQTRSSSSCWLRRLWLLLLPSAMPLTLSSAACALGRGEHMACIHSRAHCICLHVRTSGKLPAHSRADIGTNI